MKTLPAIFLLCLLAPISFTYTQIQLGQSFVGGNGMVRVFEFPQFHFQGVVRRDVNNNCLADSTEPRLGNTRVLFQKNNLLYEAFADSQGRFDLFIDTGVYQPSVDLSDYPYSSTCSLLPLGTQIENSAAIYFDFNAPIITNPVVHILEEPIFCPTYTETDTVFSCDPITWIDGQTYSTSTQAPTYLLTNEKGCDSLVKLDLTIIEIDQNILQSLDTLLVVEANANYQWVYCAIGIDQTLTYPYKSINKKKHHDETYKI